MRSYLIDSENNEFIIDLTKTIKHSSELVEFEFSSIQESQNIDSKRVFIRKLAGNYYCSFDNVAWRKLARQHVPSKVLNVDKVYNLYRGYKPSGLSSGASGDLLTQMPGKVVKLNVKVGDEVTSGDVVCILEAMKMENEIKTSVGGTVKAIHVEEGQALDSGVLMIEIE
jgi:biotin carboxyl carrier protein